MKLIFLSLSLLVIFVASRSSQATMLWSAASQAQSDAYTKDLPSDVVSLFIRIDSCDHFGGEEAYDEERKKEIEDAVNEAKCSSIKVDKNQLLEKYKTKPSVTDKIKKYPQGIEKY